LKRGTVVLASLDPTLGHEQRGLRPCVAGVRLRSHALTDRLRSIDKRRIRSFAHKPLAPDVLRQLDSALRMLLAL
jgi:mRNA-degrading endonuclease toxin of MazEF toxin-antitoxin module